MGDTGRSIPMNASLLLIRTVAISNTCSSSIVVVVVVVNETDEKNCIIVPCTVYSLLRITLFCVRVDDDDSFVFDVEELMSLLLD